jgi:hypothetical protein
MALDVQPITGTPAKVAARLCNFASGSAAPLPAHQAWLEKDVRSAVAGVPGTWVDIIGHASRQWLRTGGANAHALNLNLSRQRCEAVRQRIAAFGQGITFNIELAEGDQGSLMPNPNDGYDREVEVYVYGAGQKPRPAPAPTPSVPTRDFEIRVVGGGSASVAAQADNYFFQIVDLVRRKTAFYFYTGVGLGISIPKIPGPGSVTKMGPPTKFTTTRDAELYMFNSKASLFQDPGATLGSFSVGGTMRLAIEEIVDAAGLISTRPGLIPIEGGAGIQMPGLGSVTTGVLALTGDIYVFNGY